MKGCWEWHWEQYFQRFTRPCTVLTCCLCFKADKSFSCHLLVVEGIRQWAINALCFSYQTTSPVSYKPFCFCAASMLKAWVQHRKGETNFCGHILCSHHWGCAASYSFKTICWLHCRKYLSLIQQKNFHTREVQRYIKGNPQNKYTLSVTYPLR